MTETDCIISEKERKAAYLRAYREKNKERLAVNSKQYRIDHKKQIVARVYEWKKNNPERVKASREANKEKTALQKKQYWLARKQKVDPEKERERRRASYRKNKNNEENKKKSKIRNKVWKNEHRGRVAETLKAWKDANHEKCKSYDHERRARTCNATIEKFLASEIYERDGWRCQLCYKKVNRKLEYPHALSPSLDHIKPLALGGDHSRKNVHLAHLVCNMKAHTGGVKQLRLM